MLLSRPPRRAAPPLRNRTKKVVKGLRLGGLKEALDLVAKGGADPEEFKVSVGWRNARPLQAAGRGCGLALLVLRPTSYLLCVGLIRCCM